jgi:hypothetical protein
MEPQGDTISRERQAWDPSDGARRGVHRPVEDPSKPIRPAVELRPAWGNDSASTPKCSWRWWTVGPQPQT